MEPEHDDPLRDLVTVLPPEVKIELFKQGGDWIRIMVRCPNHYSLLAINKADLKDLKKRKLENGQLPTVIPPGFQAPPRRGKWLSPMEETILAHCSHEWQTAEQILSKAGLSVKSSSLRGILTNLAEREIIQSENRVGYRLYPDETR